MAHNHKVSGSNPANTIMIATLATISVFTALSVLLLYNVDDEIEIFFITVFALATSVYLFII